MKPIFSGTLVFLFIIIIGVGCDEGMNVVEPVISDPMDSDQMEQSDVEKPESQPVSEQTVVYVTPAEIESPSAGEPFMVSINIANGVSIAGYQVTVNFDPTALRYVSIANTDYLPAGAFVPEPKVTDSSVRILSSRLQYDA